MPYLYSSRKEKENLKISITKKNYFPARLIIGPEVMVNRIANLYGIRRYTQKDDSKDWKDYFKKSFVEYCNFQCI